ncbi:MAG: hypothetical protein KA116_09430 [Proteobacteria bacterium]|nr:hypothetical protein [Pseudomonadota bacterium]
MRFIKPQSFLIIALGASGLFTSSVFAAFRWPFNFGASKSTICQEPLFNFEGAETTTVVAEFQKFRENLDTTGTLAHLVTLSMKQLYPKEKDLRFALSKVEFLNPEDRLRLVKTISTNLLRLLPIKWDMDNLAQQKILQKHFFSKSVTMDRVIAQWKNIHDHNQLNNFLADFEVYLDEIFKAHGASATEKRKKLIGYNYKFDRELGERGYLIGALPIARDGSIDTHELDQYFRRYSSEITIAILLNDFEAFINEEVWEYFLMPNQLSAYPPALGEYLGRRIEERRQLRERLANEKVDQDLKSFSEFYRDQVQFDELNLETVKVALTNALQLKKDKKILDAIYQVADLYLLREVLDSRSQREIFIQIMSSLIHVKKSYATEFFTALMSRCQTKTFTAYDDYQMKKSIVEAARIIGAENGFKSAFDTYKWQVKASSNSVNSEWLKMSAAEARNYLDSLRDRKAALSRAQNALNNPPKPNADAIGFGAALGISEDSNNNN